MKRPQRVAFLCPLLTLKACEDLPERRAHAEVDEGDDLILAPSLRTIN
ncbi:MAG: hypothetical protein RIS36_390 [Pseudomonadota bacterium]|jgi:hypothetical protein